MKNKVKEIVLKSIDIFPSRVGYSIYHMLQNLTLNEPSFYLKTNEKSFQVIDRILKEYNIDLKSKDIAEIGSGWFPMMPLIFKTRLNVNNVLTYDINRHYSRERIQESMKLFFKDSLVSRSNTLPSFIRYFPYTPIQESNEISNVEFIYSRFVLEHISPQELYSIHSSLHSNTKENVKILHLISPSDHRSYSDMSISTYDFLKYDEEQWKRKQTKFDYHNRMRLPEYIEVFKKSGYKIEFISYDKVEKTTEKYKMFKNLKLNERFLKYTEEENLAGSIVVLLRKV